MLTNLITALIIVVLVAGAATKLIMDKKKGAPCSGCPYSGLSNQQCQHPDHSNCGPASGGNS